MHAMTRSRLAEIRSLADGVLQAMANGSGRSLIAQMADLSSAIEEVNDSLETIDSMLVEGLRDEALSMHDPELVTVSRLLEMRARADWIQLYGWLLEHGQPPPPAINIEAAEHFEAAVREAEPFRDDLARLRRLALSRAPLNERLSVLRRLRKADPARRVWVDSIASHEESRLRELQLLVPRVLAYGTIDSIAAVANELEADTWDQPPSADLRDLVEGAAEAQQLAQAATEAEEIATAITAFIATNGRATPQQVDIVISQRQRLLELAELSEQLTEVVSSNPRILELVRMNGLDCAVGQTISRSKSLLAQIEQLSLVQKTMRDFTSACQHIEYLCDHPPEKGGEAAWVGDVQRCEFITRAASQEQPDLTMPELLRERLRRSTATVEARELLRRRFWVLTSVATVATLVALVSVGGWIQWKRTEYSRTVQELEQRATEAHLGMHLERPAPIEKMATRYPGDARVEAILETFDAGVKAEASRVSRFNSRLADHAESIEQLAADVAERKDEGEERWLDAWPESFAAAATALADARRIGGLPEERTDTDTKNDSGTGISSSHAATSRFQHEEDELARAEARQSNLSETLSQLAQQAFDSQLTQIQDRLNDANDPRSLGVLLANVRVLRRQATSPQINGSPPAAHAQRIQPDAEKILDAIESRLLSLIRDSNANER